AIAITEEPIFHISKDATSIKGLQRTDGIDEPVSILVVDDIAENKEVLRGLLEPIGFKITEASNGIEAVDLTKKYSFDMILMDLVMPEMNGITAIRDILGRNTDTNRNIIVLTASVFDEDKIASQKLGCLAYLINPTEQAVLLEALYNHLPLEWEYAAPDAVDINTQSEPSQLEHSQCTILMDLVQKGAIYNIIDYLEKMTQKPDCPGQAHVLLELIKEFKLSDMRRILESTLQNSDHKPTTH
ncbi:hypothetical protein TI03_04560, partial [Achromatium sp. WMS1]